MTDSEFPPPQSDAGRRRIATRSLADATGIGCEIMAYSGSPGIPTLCDCADGRSGIGHLVPRRDALAQRGHEHPRVRGHEVSAQVARGPARLRGPDLAADPPPRARAQRRQATQHVGDLRNRARRRRRQGDDVGASSAASWARSAAGVDAPSWEGPPSRRPPGSRRPSARRARAARRGCRSRMASRPAAGLDAHAGRPARRGTTGA